MTCWIAIDDSGECMYCHGTKICPDNGGKCRCTLGNVKFFNPRSENLDDMTIVIGGKKDISGKELVDLIKPGLYRGRGSTIR